jgi:hypothetical protein
LPDRPVFRQYLSGYAFSVVAREKGGLIVGAVGTDGHPRRRCFEGGALFER